ncbi:PO21 protein, partial [Rhadina sibilatrix]|nr:PO21 protein [Rhadina sibilatrix]
ALNTVWHRVKLKCIMDHIVHLVSEIYKGITMYIITKKGKTDPINICSDVRQGDSMSLVFNLALDPLLHKLEAQGKGFHHSGFKVTAMAFADDLVLLRGSWDGMCHNIKILETFCELTGLQTQGEK